MTLNATDTGSQIPTQSTPIPPDVLTIDQSAINSAGIHIDDQNYFLYVVDDNMQEPTGRVGNRDPSRTMRGI